MKPIKGPSMTPITSVDSTLPTGLHGVFRALIEQCVCVCVCVTLEPDGPTEHGTRVLAVTKKVKVSEY